MPIVAWLSGSRNEGGLVPKLVWRVKLVAELEPGVTTETEVACLERNEEAGLADLGLRLDEAKQLTGPWCTDQGSGRIDPYPVLGSCDADIVRASQFQHAV